VGESKSGEKVVPSKQVLRRVRLRYVRGQSVKFTLDPHIPSSLFHLDSQLINQFTNAMCPLLFLGILDAFASDIGMSSIHDRDRIRQGAIGTE
jgi:hypothetical protein